MTVTNRGHLRIYQHYFQGTTPPTNFELALATNAIAPTTDTNTITDLTEASNYSRLTLSRNTTDFPNLTEDDANAQATIGIKNAVFTASGGTLEFRYILLLGNSGEVWGALDVGDFTVADGGSEEFTGFLLRFGLRTGSTRITARGWFRIIGHIFNSVSAPTTFYLPLFTSAIAPATATNVLGDLTQIATGNGYSDGGATVARSAVGFPSTEDDAGDRAFVTVVDTTYTPSGGNIPASGDPIAYAAISDDNATVASREIIAWFLVSPTVSSASPIPFSGFRIELYGAAA